MGVKRLEISIFSQHSSVDPLCRPVSEDSSTPRLAAYLILQCGTFFEPESWQKGWRSRFRLGDLLPTRAFPCGFRVWISIRWRQGSFPDVPSLWSVGDKRMNELVIKKRKKSTQKKWSCFAPLWSKARIRVYSRFARLFVMVMIFFLLSKISW